MLIAYPIAVPGWALIWGDNGTPYQWLDSTLLNLVVGFLVCGLIGFAAGEWLGKMRKIWRRQGNQSV